MNIRAVKVEDRREMEDDALDRNETIKDLRQEYR